MDIQALLCTPKTPRVQVIHEAPNTQASDDIPPSRSFSRASTQLWDSQSGPRSQSPTPVTPVCRRYAPLCTRTDRIRIKTALDLGHKPTEIHSKLGYTLRQIQYAKYHRNTPQHHRRGVHKPAINTPTRRRLEEWILQSPSHRRVAFRHIPAVAPHLELQGCGEQSIRTAFKLVGYGRRVAKRKGFSDDPEVNRERLEFARDGLTWTPDRLEQQIFSDEVWAYGGPHTQSYITCKLDGSDRFSADCVQHKYSKLPAWMFHGCITRNGKGPAVFWKKEWGSMNSSKYCAIILDQIRLWMEMQPERRLIWMQDNASCHKSKETQEWLHQRRIRWIKWPRYSPDLNLIEHVWNWMKNWIQKHHYAVYYDAAKIPLAQLKQIIWEAWEAVPNDYIQTLFLSWWDRCQAVIDAQGGPTKY